MKTHTTSATPASPASPASLSNITASIEELEALQHSSRPPVFLFGYGSLISKESRLRTLRESAAAIPCQVKGFQRSWSYKCPKKSYTAVCVSRTASSTTNGVLIPLLDPSDDLKELDSREYHYARGLVPLKDIILLPSIASRETARSEADSGMKPLLHETEKRLPTNAIVYVYENHNESFENFNTNSKSPAAIMGKIHRPCASFPIPQSYVDCILSGCLYYGEEFARDFVKSTHGWCYESFFQDRFLNNESRKYSCRNEIEEGYSFCKNTIDTLLSEVLVCNKLSRRYSNSRL